ncbi:ATP-binding cassette domain-containing protein [Patescibacteria group bacterium]|nr:ATP-binding cassette domain-containing protein [Patescibacteria group bacterium]
MADNAMIKVMHLSKRFGHFTAVDDISFNVSRGELFALLGPNGAGKSTTIKMLTTLLKPSSGKLELNGHNVVANPDLTRRSFGIVFQDPSLDNDLTAYENMELHAVMYGVPRSETAPRIEELMRLVELWDRRQSLVRTYSGGMKRRLEIARGLLHHPKVLFLDEPTLGLDAQTRTLLWNYVGNLAKEKEMTILFTTHYLEEAEANATRIGIIDHGKLLVIGTAQELRQETNTNSLEEAYLAMTGRELRDEEVDSHEAWRQRQRSRNMR